MKITINTIPHNQQRYPTVGDWRFKPGGDIDIDVSQLGHEGSEILVAIHELVEAYLCKKLGITQEEVDEFDMNYTGEIEPGDSTACPYNMPHRIATAIEMNACTVMGLRWDEHEKRINEITDKQRN